MAQQVTSLQLLSGLGAVVAIVLGVSSSCDRTIDLRITDKRNLSLSEHEDIRSRIARLERWHDSQVGD